jgi:DNA-binding transcriptional LysR family regulator
MSAATRTRSPQLDELLAFCTAADLGGIGRAAQRLHLSQPAVSKRLKALEELVGSRLLERSAQGVSMTADGERVYAHARRVLAQLDELGDLLDHMRASSETVRLAISHTAAEFVMPRALVLMRRWTSAAVEVVSANSRVVKQMVAAGTADLGVAACAAEEPMGNVSVLPLMDDEIVIAVPLGHPWARRASITPQEMLSSPLILRDPDAQGRHVIEETLTAAGLGAPQAASEVGSTHAGKDEAHELGLPTAMSRLALSPPDRLEIVAVEGMRFQRTFCILHPRGQLSPAASHLVEAFRQSAAETMAVREGGSAIEASRTPRSPEGG